MRRVFEGNEWKYASDRSAERQPTRAEQQAWVDGEYAAGRMTLERWRAAADHLARLDAAGNLIHGRGEA